MTKIETNKNIELVSEDITYKKEEKEFVLDFKGREFTVSKWWFYDEVSGDYDNDYEIKERELYEKLTDDEQVELEDFISELK